MSRKTAWTVAAVSLDILICALFVDWLTCCDLDELREACRGGGRIAPIDGGEQQIREDGDPVRVGADDVEDAPPGGVKIDYVIVAGAWMLPRDKRNLLEEGEPQYGHLSRAFRQRVVRGFQVALEFNAAALILTGGRNDSVHALDYLLHAPLHKDSELIESIDYEHLPLTVAAELRASPTVESWTQTYYTEKGIPLPFEFLYENISKTTQQNAVEAKKLILEDEQKRFGSAAASETTRNSRERTDGDNSDGVRTASKVNSSQRQGTIAVVTSPYHLRRSKMLFERVLERNVYTIGSEGSEFEWVLPPKTIYWMELQEEPTNAEQSSTGSNADSKGEENRGHQEGKQQRKKGKQEQGPTLSMATFTRFPISYFPRRWVLAAHSAVVSYRHWRGHTRCMFLSMPFVGHVREMGAFIKNTYVGHITLADYIYNGW